MARINKATLDAIFTALQGVTDALSEVPEQNWAEVQPIQSLVNQAQEIASRLEEIR